MAESKRRHSETGPVGEQLADNVADIRRQRRMTTKQLAEEVSHLGVPMTPSTITKIEKQGRRVFVDELVALAIALNVSPVTLMLPGRDLRKPVGVAPAKSMSWQGSWRWMHASVPPPEGVQEDDFVGHLNWLAENRPYLTEDEFRQQYPELNEKAADQFMDTTEEGDEEDDSDD